MYLEKLGIQGIITRIYRVSKELGYFPALTGGYLYKEGLRKDVDIVMYEERDEEGCCTGDLDSLLLALQDMGFVFRKKIVGRDEIGHNDRNFVYKSIYLEEFLFDFLFPGNFHRDDTYLAQSEARDSWERIWDEKSLEILMKNK